MKRITAQLSGKKNQLLCCRLIYCWMTDQQLDATGKTSKKKLKKLKENEM